MTGSPLDGASWKVKIIIMPVILAFAVGSAAKEKIKSIFKRKEKVK